MVCLEIVSVGAEDMSYIEIYFNSSLQNVIEIESDAVSIGRASYNQVHIDNKGVSLLHAAISKQDKEWFIEDLNSTNGTYLNGVKLTGKQKIKFGDTISICKHDLKFVDSPSVISHVEEAPQSDDGDRTLMVGNRGGHVQRANNCVLLMHGEARNINKLLLNRDYYAIGKGKKCDIRVGGWFTPKLIAEIVRLGDNYYLSPIVKKHLRLNGREVDSQIKLSNDDNITIKKLLLKFVEE